MPSIARSPASTAGSADLENGHVRVSVSIQPWCPFAPDRPYFRTFDLTLGARPRALSKSDEVENARFFAPNDQLTTSATTTLRRASTTSSEPILAFASAVGAFPPCAAASAPAFLARFVGVRVCDSPLPFRERAGSEPHHISDTFPEAEQAPPESEAPKTTALHGAACEATP